MRYMDRDIDGRCFIRPGGNIMDTLEAFCRLEEILELFGIDGAEELKAALAAAKRKTKGAAGKLPSLHTHGEDGRKIPAGRGYSAHCEDCGNYVQERPRAGHCAVHNRSKRTKPGRAGCMIEIQGEPRPVCARRPACKDFNRRENADAG